MGCTPSAVLPETPLPASQTPRVLQFDQQLIRLELPTIDHDASRRAPELNEPGGIIQVERARLKKDAR